MFRSRLAVCVLSFIAEFPSLVGGNEAPQEVPSASADVSDRLILLQLAATSKSREKTDGAGDARPVSVNELATFCSESKAHQDFPALSDAKPLSAPLVHGPEALELFETPKAAPALAFVPMVRAGLWLLSLGFAASVAARRSHRGPSDVECSSATAAHEKSATGVSAKGPQRSELHEAALAGDDMRCEVLLGGPDLFPCFGLPEALVAMDESGGTALHGAASVGAMAVAEVLLDHGALVDVEDFRDESPLHLAARGGHVEVCELLVMRGASLRAANALDCTALVVAGHAGQEAVCRCLLALGAGVEGFPDDELPDLILKLMAEVPLATER